MGSAVRQQHRRSSGFTLIEILLVIFIVAMSAIAVVSNLPPHADDQPRHMANALYYRVQLLTDEAMLSGRDFAMEVDQSQGKILFLELTDKGWQPTKLTSINQELDYADGVVGEFSVSGNGWKKDDDRLFDSDSLFDDKSDSMFDDMSFDKEKAPKHTPQVLIMSTGIVTPFTMTFSTSALQHHGWQVLVAASGQVEERQEGTDGHGKE